MQTEPGAKRLSHGAGPAAPRESSSPSPTPSPDPSPTPGQDAQALARTTVAPQPPPAPKRRRARTAILVVDGFDRTGRWGAFNEEEARDFPWVDLCLSQIERHSRSSDYEVLVWDNTWMPEHRELIERHDRVFRFQAREEGRALRHGPSLDRLMKKVRPGTEFVITVDTDSFPIRDGWIENLTTRLTDEVLVAGVWRDEVAHIKPTFVHPSCLAVRRSTLVDLGVGFAVGAGVDVAHSITMAVLERGKRISRLRRSNTWDPHWLMGGVYGDLIYHQGAGSRAPMFTKSGIADHDETVRLALRDTAFSSRLDDLFDILAGNCDPSVLPRVAALVEERRRWWQRRPRRRPRRRPQEQSAQE